MHRWYWLFPAALCAAPAGCVSYQAEPLVPAEILAEIERTRGAAGPAAGSAEETAAVTPDLARAAAWLLDFGPTPAEARAEADAARALAETSTPLPNPRIAAGPLLGYDLAPGATGALQPFVEFGFSVPLSGRRARQDEIHDLEASLAETRLLTEHRRAYLELRELLGSRVLARRRLALQIEAVESARKSLALTQRLLEAGGAGSLDVGLMEIEATEQEGALLALREREANAAAALAGLVGVRADRLGEPSAELELPLLAALPDLVAAKEILVENHLDLAVLRERHALAEKELRLEVARQYPDLDVGASWEGDPGDTKKVLGLTLGIELPLFDRNEQGIAVAAGRRAALRAAYAAALSQALAALEGAYATHALAGERRRLIESVMLPRAEANLDLAFRSIQAGTLDALKYLEVERRVRALRAAALAADEDLFRALSAIERLIGRPLALLPGEAAAGFPQIETRYGKEER
ncbi:MAG: TolC family protein [Planctomycetes bacterium]|nr:TolC family protein [Planctomycetota bacterium]